MAIICLKAGFRQKSAQIKLNHTTLKDFQINQNTYILRQVLKPSIGVTSVTDYLGKDF